MKCKRGHEFDKPLILVCDYVKVVCPICKGELLFVIDSYTVKMCSGGEIGNRKWLVLLNGQ